MNSEIRTAIETLGDPSRLDAGTPVSYPRVSGQHGEEELYQWFVSNDQQRDPELKAVLQPVSGQIEKLPRLRCRRRGDN